MYSWIMFCLNEWKKMMLTIPGRRRTWRAGCHVGRIRGQVRMSSMRMRVWVRMEGRVVHTGKWIPSEGTRSWRTRLSSRLSKCCFSSGCVRRSKVIVCLMMMWGCHHKVLGVFGLHLMPKFLGELIIIIIRQNKVRTRVAFLLKSHDWQKQWLILSSVFLILLLLLLNRLLLDQVLSRSSVFSTESTFPLLLVLALFSTKKLFLNQSWMSLEIQQEGEYKGTHTEWFLIQETNIQLINPAHDNKKWFNFLVLDFN